MLILLLAVIFLAGATGCAFLWFAHHLAALQSSLLQLAESVRVQNADLDPLAVAIRNLHSELDPKEKINVVKDLFHKPSGSYNDRFSNLDPASNWPYSDDYGDRMGFGGGLLGDRRRFGGADFNLKRGHSSYDDLYGGEAYGYNYDRASYSRHDPYDRYGSGSYDRYDSYDRYGGYDRYDNYDRYGSGLSYGSDGLYGYSSSTRKGLQREFQNKTRSLELAMQKHNSTIEHTDGQWLIPKVVHQTWKTDAVPSKYTRHMISWRRLHRHWEFEFWDDVRIRAVIIEHFPQWIHEFDRMSGIKRADVARLAILYVYGGVYADIDVEATRCFDDLLVAASAVRAGVLLGEENFVHSVLLEHKSTWLVSNAVMASARKHPFWLQALREIFQSTWCGDDPVQCTGPRLVDRVSWDYVRRTPACGVHKSSYGCVVRLPYAYFSPHIAEWNAGNMLRECRERDSIAGLYHRPKKKQNGATRLRKPRTRFESALRTPNISYACGPPLAMQLVPTGCCYAGNNSS